MTENNAAQPGLTDDERNAVYESWLAAQDGEFRNYSALMEAIESALLSKLRAPVADVAEIIRDVCELDPAAEGPDTVSVTVADLRRIIERYSAPVAGEATDDDIRRIAALPECHHGGDFAHAVDPIPFARALLARYAAPQASDAVRNLWAEGFQTGLDKALEVLEHDEFATRIQSAQVIRALKSQPQAAKDGALPPQSAAIRNSLIAEPSGGLLTQPTADGGNDG
ncbi:hypothetical protein D9M72_287330 [compost metagenome]